MHLRWPVLQKTHHMSTQAHVASNAMCCTPLYCSWQPMGHHEGRYSHNVVSQVSWKQGDMRYMTVHHTDCECGYDIGCKCILWCLCHAIACAISCSPRHMGVLFRTHYAENQPPVFLIYRFINIVSRQAWPPRPPILPPTPPGFQEQAASKLAASLASPPSLPISTLDARVSKQGRLALLSMVRAHSYYVVHTFTGSHVAMLPCNRDHCFIATW
jgi:hypothetical protein